MPPTAVSFGEGGSSPIGSLIRPIAAMAVQYRGVFAGYTQNIGFSKLTPPLNASKVALVHFRVPVWAWASTGGVVQAIPVTRSLSC
jgi:hypothetical protein